MECANFDQISRKSLVCKNGVTRVISRGSKLTRAVYAGLIVCFVPSVMCQDWSRRLTFEEIYNDTNYAQLQPRPRPYDMADLSYNLADFRILEDDRRIANDFTDSLEDERENEVDIEFNYALSDVIKEPLLVGFSHDPYRYSVPEDDFLKGVRNMNPKSIINKGENRGKRGVLHLYNMMYCATGCEPLSYKGYGCYCGFLGSGKPTDGIDRCCKMHDECYENIYCPFFTVYFQPYYWKCYRNQPLCAKENYHTQHQFINGCAARLCECDRKFAMCVKKYPCPRRRALCRSSPIRLLQNLLMFR